MNGSAATSPDAYPFLRECLAPQYAALPGEAIESYMEQRFGAGAAPLYDEYLEGFFDDIGRTFKRVAPIVANVAGGAARGAMSGSALGLPGIIGGAVAGGAGTALTSYGKGTARDIGRVLNTGTQIAGQFSPASRLGGGIGAALGGLAGGRRDAAGLGSLLAGGGGGGAGLASLLGGGGGGAAGQLFSLLRRPEVQQALTALNLGPAGRRTVPVGVAQTPVPTTAIAGLMQNLAANAVSEAAAESDGAESDLEYMADDAGEFVGDPTQESDRATRVWELLNQAQIDRLQAIGHQHAVRSAAQRAHAMHADCPHCARAARLARAAGRAAAFEAYGEAFAEDYSETLDETLDESLDEALWEDITEDATVLLADDITEDWNEGLGEFAPL